MKKQINNELIDMTAEEITEAENRTKVWQTEKQAVQTAKAEKENLKGSAKAKLIAGEALTEDEANTIVL